MGQIGKGPHNAGRDAVAILATCFVMMLGLVICGFIILAFNKDPTQPLIACAVLFSSSGLLLWLLREKPKNRVLEEECFWFSRKRKCQHEPVYNPVRRKNTPPEQLGTNKPPSVESIRDLADGLNTWVPSKKRTGDRRSTWGRRNLKAGLLDPRQPLHSLKVSVIAIHAQ